MQTYELPLIDLSKQKQPFIARKGAVQNTLDLISSTLLEPTTLVTKGPRAAISKVRERRLDIARTKDIGKALNVAGEAVTSAGLAAGVVLGAAYPAAAKTALVTALPKTPKGILATVTGAGILTTSKTARKYVGNVLQDPTKLGREAGLLIDKAAGQNKSLPSVGDALKKAGLIGAGVVTGATALKAGKALYNKLTTKTADKVADVMPSAVGAYSLGSVPTAFSPTTSEPVVSSPAKEPAASSPQAPPVNVKVINKPQVNVAVAQSL